MQFYLVLGLTAGGKLNFNFQNLKLDRLLKKQLSSSVYAFDRWIRNIHSTGKEPQLEVASIRVRKLKQ